LSTQSDIDATRLGLIGGSQAGWVIPVAAALSEHAAFFVILSGPVVSVGHEGLYSSYTNDGEAAANYDAARLEQMLRGWPSSGVDPVPVIATLRQPGLWLWGGADQSVPVKLSAENLQALIDAGQSNLRYVIFPQADHSLAASTHGLIAEQAYAPNLVHYPALSAWLDEQGLTTP
jgi:pimeloyl-ACP methyl ester carboxylesterase